MSLSLAELVGRFYCSEALWDAEDDELGFGCWLAGNKSSRMNPKRFSEYGEAEASVKRLPGFTVPKPYEDLYEAPSRQDGDGVHRIQVYGYKEVPSSQALARDWRYLFLASEALVPFDLGDADIVILELYHPAGVVQADIKRSTWNTMVKAKAWAAERPNMETPGTHCFRCALRDAGCKSFKALGATDDTIPDIRDKKVLAQRLLLEYVDTKVREAGASKRRKELACRFRALAEDGRVNVGGLFKIEAGSATVDRFAFSPVFRLLTAAGLWTDDLARIEVSELKRRIHGFPAGVQRALNAVKFTDTKDPEIKGLAHAGEHTVEAPFLRGLVGPR